MKIPFDRGHKAISISDNQPVKKRRWDRWLYFIIFGVIVFSFLKWLFTPVFYDLSEGVLLQNHFDIKLIRDSQIEKYWINDGQSIQKNDTLFRYIEFTEASQKSFIQDSLEQQIEAFKNNANIIALEGQIRKRKDFINSLQERLSFWKQEKEHKEKLVYLNVIPRNELANITRSIDDISYELSTTEAERQALLEELYKLKQQSSKVRNLSSKSLIGRHQPHHFLAPIAGKVDRIKIDSGEIAYRKDPVLSIIQPTYFVRGFVKMKRLNEFVVGDKVKISLPYKHEKLNGIVTEVYAISDIKDDIIIPEKYENQKYGGVIKVTPESGQNWSDLNFSNIPVTIEKLKSL